MRILILGAGGLGGYFGARLAQAGADVTFVARGAHLAAMVERGLRVHSVRGDVHLPRVQAAGDIASAGPADVVLLCVKAWDLEEAARSLAPVLHDGTRIITTQNGIDVVDRLAPIVGRHRIAGGAAYGVFNLRGPGEVEHTTQVHRLVFGPFGGGPDATLRAFQELGQRAGFDAVLSDDIESVLWEKFLFICAYSGVTTLLGKSIGPILADDGSRSLFVACMREIQSIAHALGVAIPDAVVERQLTFARSLEPGSTSSMSRDRDAGRRLELDLLNATIARMGRDLGVPTPVNQAITSVLEPLAGTGPRRAGSKEQAYRTALRYALRDRQLSPEERASLANLAVALGLDDVKVHGIHGEFQVTA